MKKQLKFDCCIHCPYFKYNENKYECGWFAYDERKEIHKNDIIFIQDWCPLEDCNCK